jgi:hypothetical protein
MSLEHRHLLPAFDQQPHRIREVELALRVHRLDLLERRPQFVSLEDVDGGVHLPDRALSLVGVRMLDDLPQAAVVVADDAAVGARVGRFEGEHGRRHAGAAMFVHELLQQLGAEPGMVT